MKYKLSTLLQLKSIKGQILPAFLIIMAIGITITLSLISRTTTDIRTTTTTEQSSRAYNAAEAGVEDALKKLESGDIVPGGGSGSTAGQTSYTYTVTNVGSSNKAFVAPEPLAADSILQVWLANYQTLSPVYNNPRIKIYWGNPGTNVAAATSPAVEVSLVYRNKSTGVFGTQKWYYRPTGSSIPSGFNPSTEVSTTPLTINEDDNNLAAKQSFAFSISEGGNSGINLSKINYTNNDPILLRIRMLYNSDAGHVLAVVPYDASSQLPIQGHQIESTGVAPSGATRRIKVFRSFPSPASLFDYALFDGSKNRPLKK